MSKIAKAPQEFRRAPSFGGTTLVIRNLVKCPRFSRTLEISGITIAVFSAVTLMSQAAAQTTQRWHICEVTATSDRLYKYFGGPFEANSEEVRAAVQQLIEKAGREFPVGAPWKLSGCFDYETREYADSFLGRIKGDMDVDDKRRTQFSVGWLPFNLPPQSTIRILTLDFEPGDGSSFLHARRGYRRASIKLNYRFLLCANEIQMAYALDRKSLEHSRDYVDKFNGINPNMMVPNSEPPVPMTVPLAVKIVRAVPGTPYVATIRDGTAGEALGMSCFTGQTARVGYVAKLIGPQATRPQIKAFIDTLRADDITPGASLGYALINPDIPAPPAATPRPRTPVRRKVN